MIHSGDGKIRNVKWSPVSKDQYNRETSFIVFSTDHNVRIFDTSVKAIITVIKKDHDPRLDSNLIKCSIHFESSARLLLSWGDSVKIIEIKTRPNDSFHPSSSIHFDRSILPDPDLPDKYAEIVSMFHVNYNIAGISRFKSSDCNYSRNQTSAPSSQSNILLLVVDKGITIGSTPQFMIMKPESDEGIEISSDILSTKGYQHYQCLDYHLESLINDDLYFIVCPKDVISVSPREEDDHISWLIERNRYEEALEAIKSYQTKLADSRLPRSKMKQSRFTYVEVGKQFIDHLIFTRSSDDDVIKAAEFTPLIAGSSIDTWNEIFDKFENVTRLRSLQPYLPIGVASSNLVSSNLVSSNLVSSNSSVTPSGGQNQSGFKLSQDKYEAVLNEFINHDPEGLLRVIEDWSLAITGQKMQERSPVKVSVDPVRSKASFSSLSSAASSPPTATSFAASFARSGSGLFSRGTSTSVPSNVTSPPSSAHATSLPVSSQSIKETVCSMHEPLYDVKKMKQSLLSVLQFKSDSNLLRALAHMYQFESSYDEALKIYLKLGDSKRVFELISKFDLFSTLREKLSFFMKLNPIEASKLLISNQNKIPIDEVVEKLKSKPHLLWVYLDEVFHENADACADHHDLLINLYANHAPEKLLNLLKISNHYSLESAFKLVEAKQLVSEMVFLLSRMGNNKQALHYITDSLKDINRAIEFCQEEDDIELWHDLITLSANEPAFIVKLLTNISTYIPDPVMLINSIPDKLIIPNLKSALINYLDDFKIEINIQEKCKSILVNDCYQLTQAYVRNARRASSIYLATKCSKCKNEILPKGGFLIGF